MKIFLFYFEIAIKKQGRHKIIGSVGLAETHLFFRPYLNVDNLVLGGGERERELFCCYRLLVIMWFVLGGVSSWCL